MLARSLFTGVMLGLLVACGGPERTTAAPVSPTASATFSLTATAFPTPSATSVPLSPTRTVSPTPPPSATTTPTLATPVIHITAIMPGVRPLAGAFTPTDLPVPDPPRTLPNAAEAPPPGWQAFESDHPALNYTGAWHALPSYRASRGEYHFSVDPDAAAELVFEGEAVRVRYVAFWNGGIWTLSVDGVVRAVIDGYAPQAVFGFTAVLRLDPGRHTLTIQSTGEAHPASSDVMVGLDAIDVYRRDPDATPAAPATPASPTPTFQPAAQIALRRGAPTIRPTATAPAPAVVDVSLIIAYDENANRSIDPAEGVRGIPVRLVEVGTNRVLTATVTDAAGLARLEAVTNSPVRLIAPYFGAYWEVRRVREPQSFSLLLPPGNQPGLIP